MDYSKRLAKGNLRSVPMRLRPRPPAVYHAGTDNKTVMIIEAAEGSFSVGRNARRGKYNNPNNVINRPDLAAEIARQGEALQAMPSLRFSRYPHEMLNRQALADFYLNRGKRLAKKTA